MQWSFLAMMPVMNDLKPTITVPWIITCAHFHLAL